MTKSTTFFTLLLALVLLGGPAALAETAAERDRRAVLELVMRQDPPPTLRDWERAGPQANRILVELYQERTLRPSTRLRALACLAWFPSKRTEAVLTGVLYSREVGPTDRRVAMQALALAFGERMVGDLRPFLSESDPLIREGAIRALGEIRVERARAVLRHHLGLERDLYLRQVTEEVLAQSATPAPRAPAAPQPTSRAAR